MQAFFLKLICAKLGIDWTSAPWLQSNVSCCENFWKYNGRLGVYSYSSIEKLPDDPFVSAATADTCSMVNLVCLFMKPHLLALL